MQSLRAKASLLFFAVFMVVILPVSFIIYFQLRNVLTDADARELKTEAEKIASRVRVDPPFIPLPPGGYLLKIQFHRNGITEEVFTSPDFPDVPDESFSIDHFSYDSLSIVNIKDVSYQNGLILSLARSNQILQTQLNNLFAYLFLASVGSVLAAGILVYLSSGIMLRPIKKIIDVAQRIQASNSIERVPVPHTLDESRQLAETLNGMLSRIEASIKNQVNFFASAAHELKTPLAIMQTEVTLALAKVNDQELNKILQSQLQEIQRLDRVIQDFLLISQLKSETLTLREREVGVEEILYAAIRKLRYLVKERESQIQVMVEDGPMNSHVDFDKMETVLTNLIENAIRYSLVKSTIHVTLVSKDGWTTITCRNPIQKPIQNLELLTSEFKSDGMSSGLGMGLWICDQIVKLHKGKLNLSQQDGFFEARVSLQKS